jgi:hypothetical protein
MKKLILFMCVMFSITNLFSQSVGIGTNNPSSSAALDISHTSKGLLIPRMTTVQRNAISSPANGLLVYDIGTSGFWFYNGGTWVSLAGSGGFSLPYYNPVNIADTAFHVKNSGSTAIAGEGTNTTGVAGISNSSHGLEGSSVSGNGVYGNSFSSNGVNAYSFNGNGILANSTNGSAVYGFSNNANATIYGTNSNGLGVGVQGNATLHHGVLGTSAGTSKAGIRGEATGNGGYGVYGTTTSSSGYGVYGNNAAGVAVFGSSNTGTGVRAVSNSGLALDVVGNMKISGGSTNPSYGAVLTSDATGNVSWKNNRVAFSASGMNLNFQLIAPSFFTKFHFSDEQYDLGADYVLFTGATPASTSSNFIVPVSGIYHFDVSASIGASGSQVFIEGIVRLRVKRGASEFTATASDMAIYTDYLGSALVGNISRDIQLQAGDQVFLELYQRNDENGTSFLGGANMNGRLVIAD